MSMASKKIPIGIVCGILCFALGVGLTIAAQMIIYPTNPQAAANPANGEKAAKEGGDSKGNAKMGKGGGGDKKGPSAKVQLTRLVTKLDVLANKPLKFELSPDQKKQVKELIADLDSKEAVTDEEAQQKLDAILKLLDAQKETMIAAGYQWPGEGGGGGGGGGGGQPPPNPFKTGQNADHLKSLQTALSK
jgi:hypothetical protein